MVSPILVRGLLAMLLFAPKSIHAAVPPRGPQFYGLVRRQQASSAEAVLSSLSATAFCSSFDGIQDVTKTKTSTSATVTLTATVTPGPCTKTASEKTVTTTVINSVDGSTVTSTKTANGPGTTITQILSEGSEETLTIQTSITITNPVSTQTFTSIVTVTSTVTVGGGSKRNLDRRASSTSVSGCTSDGIPAQLQTFSCQAISKACSSYVLPTTTTLTVDVEKTVSKTTTLKSTCLTITPAAQTVTTYTDKTAKPTTTITTVTSPKSTVFVTFITSSPPTTTTEIITHSFIFNSVTAVYVTSTYTEYETFFSSTPSSTSTSD